MRTLTRLFLGGLWASLLLAGCGLFFKEEPNNPGGPNVPIVSPPAGFMWDSGEQQCQMGRMKLVYRYRMQSSPLSNYKWELWYHVKAENSNLAGQWSQAPALYRLYYFFTYPNGVAPTETGNVELNNQGEATGVIMRGNDYHPFDTRVLTLKRSGGSSGIETTWPNTQGCVSG